MAIKIKNVIVVNDDTSIVNVLSANFTGNSAVTLPTGNTATRPSGNSGMLRYNTDSKTFEGYSTYWGAIGGGGSVGNVQVISANTTAISGNVYVITANLTLFLPTTPTVANTIYVSNLSGYSNSQINRSSQNIMGVSQDLNIDVSGAGFMLVYSGATNGWVIV